MSTSAASTLKIQKKSKAQARRERKRRTLAKFATAENEINPMAEADAGKGQDQLENRNEIQLEESQDIEESHANQLLNEAVEDAIELPAESRESNESNQMQVTWPDLNSVPRHLRKYWFQKYSLFHKFDQGIQMDEVGWFSVTPEVIANATASKFVQSGITSVCDGFCGVGGNAIAFARQGLKVIAIELDQTRLNCAKNNARVYGVEHLITFIHGDFMAVQNIMADSVFLSPPWGGIDYINDEIFDIESMPINGIKLFEKAKQISPNICYFLPKNVDHNQLIRLSAMDQVYGGGRVELEKVFLDDRLKCWNAFYGPALGP